MQPTKEDLKNSEETRLNVVMDSLREWSSIHEKMNMHYMETLANYKQERRDMFKYLGTIAGGAAALAPQLLDHVKQPSLFYSGIGFLCLVVIIAATYVISSVENDTTALLNDLNQKNEMISKMRKPKIDFITSTDHSIEAFVKAMSEGKEYLPKEGKEDVPKKGWYQAMEYTGEYIIFFTVIGLASLAFSLTGYHLLGKEIVIIVLLTFLIINIVSAFPTKIFTILGAPIDLIKSLFRLLKKEV